MRRQPAFLLEYKEFGMTFTRVILTFLILLNSCCSQERGGTDPRAALPILSEILGKANASGSLEYWGRCDVHEPSPDLPMISYPANDSGATAEVLKKLFANDRWMRVTQEPNGLVRMAESDVPTDLLDVRIKHLSFGSRSEDSGLFGGPNNAKRAILFAPEVRAYRKAHNIGPFADRWVGPSDGSSQQKVTGDLNNVTVRQALDYILQFYPGFWIYENCQNDKSKPGRDIFLRFFQTEPHQTHKTEATHK